jgi:undecaprenyl pyrophosphate phosphatase UppP
MIKLLLNTFLVGFLEPFILDSKANIKIIEYYFGKHFLLSNYDLVYFALMLAIFIFFIPRFMKMFLEFFSFLKDVFRYKIKATAAFKEYKMFNMLVAIFSLSFFTFIFKVLFKPVFLDLKWICIIFILSSVLLKGLSLFKTIRIDSYSFKISDILIISFLNLLGFIPGVSHTFVIIFTGIMLGLELNILVYLSFLSLVPYIFINKLNFNVPSIDGFYGYLDFFIMLIFLLFIINFVYRILIKNKFYKFYLYLLGLGLWTIIDITFSK